LSALAGGLEPLLVLGGAPPVVVGWAGSDQLDRGAEVAALFAGALSWAAGLQAEIFRAEVFGPLEIALVEQLGLIARRFLDGGGALRVPIGQPLGHALQAGHGLARRRIGEHRQVITLVHPVLVPLVTPSQQFSQGGLATLEVERA